MVLFVSTRSVLHFLMCCIAVLLGMDALLLFMKFGLGHESVYGITYLFDVNAEQNIPTLFSTLDLVLASALLWAHYRELRASRRTGGFYWLGLAAIFALLAIDEFASLHERLNKPIERIFHTSGSLMYGWVIPYAVLVLVFGAAYLGFWWRLPKRYRTLFGVAGVVYVFGALGMEMVGAKLDSIYGMGGSLAAGIEILAEEGMEMSGIALFVYALLESLRDRGVMMRFAPDIAELNNAELSGAVPGETYRDVA
jgi:hypothetical protein